MDQGAVTQVIGEDPPETPSKLDRAKFLTSKIKSDVKNILNRADSDSSSSHTDTVPDIFEDAAFNPQKIPDASTHDRSSLRRQLHRGVHGAAVMIKNPKRALRSRYTRNVAANLSGEPGNYERRYDEDLVDAHDSLARANAGAASRSDPFADGESDAIETQDEEEVERAKDRVRHVEAQRDSVRSAWILGRHVRRARVVRPISRRPRMAEYGDDTPGTAPRKVRWDTFLAHLALWYSRGFTAQYIDDIDEPPFDLNDLSLAIERFAIVSAPWQSFAVDLRNVYLWQNPRRTAGFLVTYLVLWYFQHIVTAMLAWIIFVTIRNRFRPTTVEAVRERVRRAKDRQSRAKAWGELIQRHGKHDWVEPLLDQVGPIVQLQLTDLSDLIEMVQNFCRWERPRKTSATLFFFVSCWLLTAFTDMVFCVRLVQLGLGFMFFFTFPIAARFPKYRKLVNPVYWVFWDVPSLADLSIVQLQKKMASRDAELLRNLRDPGAIHADKYATAELVNDGTGGGTFGPAEADDAGSIASAEDETLARALEGDQFEFQAVNANTHADGHLIVGRQGLWYRDKKARSFHSYARLIEIRKVDLSKTNNTDVSARAKLAKRIEKYTALRFLPSGLEFVFLSSSHNDSNTLQPMPFTPVYAEQHDKLTLTVSESDRDKIFSLAIGWSNLRWQPHFSSNTKARLMSGSDHPTRHGKGNAHLDETVKGIVQ